MRSVLTIQTLEATCRTRGLVRGAISAKASVRASGARDPVAAYRLTESAASACDPPASAPVHRDRRRKRTVCGRARPWFVEAGRHWPGAGLPRVNIHFLCELTHQECAPYNRPVRCHPCLPGSDILETYHRRAQGAERQACRREKVLAAAPWPFCLLHVASRARRPRHPGGGTCHQEMRLPDIHIYHVCASGQVSGRIKHQKRRYG